MDSEDVSAIRIASSRAQTKIGLKQRVGSVAKYMGPAFVVSVAYMDPGNFATNIAAGSQFNYSLLWVILWSNAFAILLQSLSAKLGIATGKNLTEHCRELFSAKVNWVLWVVGILAAIATNVAEILGGALGFYLLLGIPVVWGAIITGLIGHLILALGRYGQERIEGAIALLVSVISLCYVIELFLAKPNWSEIAVHTFIPSVPGGGALFVAVGMLGATVMPHVVYLHSHLVQSRREKTVEAHQEHYIMEKIDVTVAMNVAFVINAAMVVVSAATFFSRGIAVESIQVAHQTLQPLLGRASAMAFGAALLASGLSSTAVGTYAGQVIASGFVRLRPPPWVGRLLATVPAIGVIALGGDPVKVLVTSQVILSFALPAAVIPLLIITGNKRVMGQFANTNVTKVAGWVVAALIVGLNAALIWQALRG